MSTWMRQIADYTNSHKKVEKKSVLWNKKVIFWCLLTAKINCRKAKKFVTEKWIIIRHQRTRHSVNHWQLEILRSIVTNFKEKQFWLIRNFLCHFRLILTRRDYIEHCSTSWNKNAGHEKVINCNIWKTKV